MRNGQNDCCAVCLDGFNGKFCIDHNHETGVIRGLLCRRCNTGMGLMRDSVKNFEMAISYLGGHL